MNPKTRKIIAGEVGISGCGGDPSGASRWVTGGIGDDIVIETLPFEVTNKEIG